LRHQSAGLPSLTRLYGRHLQRPEAIKHGQSQSPWAIEDVLLIAGTAVGAGALALPEVTSSAGFIPSSVALVLAALFSISTGLLIAETVINTLTDRQADDATRSESDGLMDGLDSLSLTSISVSLLNLNDKTKLIIVMPYLLLHYACLCAYGVKGSEVIQIWTSLDFPQALAAFTVSLGGACFFLPSKTMDKLNSLLVILLSVSFVGLLFAASEGFEIDRLISRYDPTSIIPAIPIILLSFVYHNVIPILVTKQITKGSLIDSDKIKTSIIAGVSIPLTMFLLWEGAVLGSGSGAGSDPLTWLRQSSSISGLFINAFTLLAVSTSYIAFVFSLSGFIQDAFEVKGGKGTKAGLYLITLVPPAIWALIDQDSFITALDIGGTYGVLLLFGILPALLSYAQRYSKGDVERDRVVLLGGGKPPLFLIGGTSLAIITQSLLQ
jgi:tyrosine-specific transport protein